MSAEDIASLLCRTTLLFHHIIRLVHYERFGPYHAHATEPRFLKAYFSNDGDVGDQLSFVWGGSAIALLTQPLLVRPIQSYLPQISSRHRSFGEIRDERVSQNTSRTKHRPQATAYKSVQLSYSIDIAICNAVTVSYGIVTTGHVRCMPKALSKHHRVVGHKTCITPSL